MDLRYSTAFADTQTCDVAPGLGDLGIADARLIAPGAALLTEWVNSLTSCN